VLEYVKYVADRDGHHWQNFNMWYVEIRHSQQEISSLAGISRLGRGEVSAVSAGLT
jgi:hypothetical protein